MFIGCSHNNDIIKQRFADLEMKLTTLQDSVMVLNQTIEIISSERIEVLEKDVSYLQDKIDLLDEQLSFYNDRVENIIDLMTSNSRKSTSTEVGKSNNTSVSVPAETLYAQARNYYIKRDLLEAKKKFNEFINSYPSHELKVNCLYWLAEIDFDEGKYNEAIDKFREVSRNSINSEKSLDSLFKIAIINKMLGKYDLALAQAKTINKNYSDYIRIDKVKAFIKDLEK